LRKLGLLMVISVLPALLVWVPALAAGQILVVDDDAAATATDCDAAVVTPHRTIQSAVTAAAAGDIVKVCPGAYPESVIVPSSKSDLQIQGAKVGVDARSAARTNSHEESIVNPPEAPTAPSQQAPVGFSIEADGVVVDGFTISGSVPVSGQQLPQGEGVRTFKTASGYRILNNIITGKTLGIYLNSSGARLTEVRQNLITQNNKTCPPDSPCAATGNGIYSDDGLIRATIADNRISGQENAAIVITGTATTTQSVITISGNEVVPDADDMTADRGVFLFRVTGSSSVTGNAIAAGEGSGLVLGGGNDGITITDNRIRDRTGSGVNVQNAAQFAANRNIVVSGNLLQNNNVGISTAPPVSTTATGSFDPATFDVHANRIVGNALGLDNDDPARALDAANNWWGCNAGPSRLGCDFAQGSVTTSPWLVLTVTSDKTSLGKGEKATITADLTKNSDGEDTSAQGTIPSTPVSFFTDRGTIEPPVTTTTAGKATATLTHASNTIAGPARASASVDGEAASTTVTMTGLDPQPSASPSPSPSNSPSPAASASASPSPSASATASPSPGPTLTPPPPPENERATSTITFKYGAKERARGRVSSSDSRCEDRRNVVVKKVRRGRDKVVRRTFTDSSGAWKTGGTLAPGRYYAQAQRTQTTTSTGTFTCVKARSEVRRIR